MRLRVEDLSRRFTSGDREVVALDHVSLTIEPGEFVAIVGKSGSGKTTLLNALGGLDTSYQGAVFLGDDAPPLHGLSEPELARARQRHLGYVFQHFNLLDHLSALENVALPAFFGGEFAGAPALARAAQLLAHVGLEALAHTRPPLLSGGQKQRVAIARALFQNPDILLCDEPTGSLDHATGLQILDIFESLNRTRNMTVILVTHERHVAARARRRIVIDQGRVIEDALQTPHREVSA
ncbi:macrolide ABC transporter ATP-binding protein [Lujinxingia litoralis]|uniref:Macrolide ABC transporter ATP-binding protein n=1 Tax=Lujinxingia litoralis TaxID=2211119 RepID=A0A328CC77_9DELT|nr:ABC transporter ATP-binding protein [Lujinxingia litoralis]RAL24771.1 macrolide ABC transporter ATP-binding protein [Lujinxingia litoralis]